MACKLHLEIISYLNSEIFETDGFMVKYLEQFRVCIASGKEFFFSNTNVNAFKLGFIIANKNLYFYI